MDNRFPNRVRGLVLARLGFRSVSHADAYPRAPATIVHRKDRTVSRAEQQSTSARRSWRPRLIPVAVGLGMALAVTGCGASQFSQTASQVAAVNGAEGNAGQMLIRNAELRFPTSGQKYAAGSDATLELTIVNGGDKADQLLKVSSPNAGGANVSGQSTIPARFAVSSDQTGGAASGSQAGKIRIALTGLTQDVTPGQKIAVTFLFRDAGPVTMQLPIGAPASQG